MILHVKDSENDSNEVNVMICGTLLQMSAQDALAPLMRQIMRFKEEGWTLSGSIGFASPPVDRKTARYVFTATMIK